MVRQMPPTVSAWYRNITEALGALRQLEAANISSDKITLTGRGVRWHSELQRYFNPAADMGRGILPGLGIGAFLGLIVSLVLGFLPAFQKQMLFWSPWMFFLMVVAFVIVGGELGGFVTGVIALDKTAARYRMRILAGQFVLAVRGTPEELEQAWTILNSTGKVELSGPEKSEA